MVSTPTTSRVPTILENLEKSGNFVNLEKSGNFLSSQGILYVIVIFHRSHLLACRNSKIFSGGDTPGPPKRDGIEEVRKQGQKFKGEPCAMALRVINVPH